MEASGSLVPVGMGCDSAEEEEATLLSSMASPGDPLSPSGPLHCLILTEAGGASLALGMNNRACFELDSRDVSFFS